MKSTSTKRLLEWSEKIKKQKLSNMGVAAWCSEQNISPNTFQYWKKRINRASPQVHKKSSFLELPDEQSIIEISLRGIKLEISRDFDRNALVNFLSLLKSS